MLEEEGVAYKHWDASKQSLVFEGFKSSYLKLQVVVMQALLALADQTNQHQYPPEWAKYDGSPWTVYDDDDSGPLLVDATPEEVQFCEQAFKNGGVSAPLLRVQRVQNPMLWIKYANAKTLLQKKGDVNEKWLFHGTRKADPTTVAETTGIDFRYSAPGLFGRGSYFAERSSYSTSYEYKTLDGKKQMFLARIAAGTVDERGMRRDQAIIMPKPGHDSVRGNVREPDNMAYIIYDLAQSYPSYLLTYK
eukprot:m.272918 g.272918  ORF g.272918 m.272918 type:complete len:248 (-) comp17681_c0_seq4:65-808(-)